MDRKFNTNSEYNENRFYEFGYDKVVFLLLYFKTAENCWSNDQPQLCAAHFIRVYTQGFFFYFLKQTFIEYTFIKNIIFIQQTN
jgi:hypothetical protein